MEPMKGVEGGENRNRLSIFPVMSFYGVGTGSREKRQIANKEAENGGNWVILGKKSL